MVQTIQALDMTLAELTARFGLTLVRESDFFLEWQVSAETTELERTILDRVQANFLAFMERSPVLENSVKMVVLSPLLDLAGFYRMPYRIETETSVELEMEDEGEIIRGRIDVLVLYDALWVLVIESKRAAFDIATAIPQALAYMLANPVNRPSFGLITNGHGFIFLKLTRQPTVQYANSRVFSLFNPGNELNQVLQVLKKLGEATLAVSAKQRA
jgi:predicted type IV restriction endonuclease